MIGWTERLWIGLLAAPLCAAAPGCLKDPGFACESNAVCFLDNVSGECDLVSATCVYPTEGCAGLGGYRDGEGNCVGPPNGGAGMTTDGSSNTNGNTTVDPTTTGGGATTTEPIEDDDVTTRTSGDQTTTDPSTETDTNVTPTDSEGESSSGESVDCASQLESVTSQGLVGVSSTFTGYDAELSVDGDVSTSWFSQGPEGGGAPSVYTWTTQVEMCISRVFVADNAQHANPDFRTGYGFTTGTVRVFNDDNTVVFEELFPLDGRGPDGDITANTGGVIGSRVVLELDGHENPSCGGFSELQVLGGLL